jgi:3-dehydrosphinganine reductase
MHVVVTGGSSGIGLEVAKIYAGQGASVTLIARNAERLEAARLELERVAGGRGRIVAAAADVADADAVSAAIETSETAIGSCDILVACAGIVAPAWFHEQGQDVFRAQWETNYLGVVNAVRATYSGMRLRSQGRIMIVSSAAAFIGIPGYASYCGSKSALVGFADALRLEAMPAGISVGICFPPDTDTPQLEMELQHRPVEAEMLMGRIRPQSADKIATLIVAGVDKKNARVYFNLSIAALALFGPWTKPFVEFWYRWRKRR